jgi:pimeloyl-ACP methyl ester carboxylesterase
MASFRRICSGAIFSPISECRIPGDRAGSARLRVFDKPRYARYTIDEQASAVKRLEDGLGIGSATIVGASYGGAIAATLALIIERVESRSWWARLPT